MMTVRPRGRAIARGGCLTGAALSLLLAFVAPGAGAQEPDGAPELPDAFAASASASAITVSMLTPAIVPVEDLFVYGIAEGRGTYDSSSQEARASLFFPGNGFVKGPGLACGEFFGPNIPPEGEPIFGPIVDACLAYHFPLAVFADSLTPDQQTEGYTSLGEPSDPVSFDATGARAHAGLDATWTDSQVNDFRLTGAPSVGNIDRLLGLLGLDPTDASLFTVDGATATTDQRIVDGGTLVSDARATVNGLRLLGGLVHIGSIVSHSSVTSVPGEEPVADATLEFSGVTVAGQPAQITEDGLVLGTSSSGPVAQQLASQVAAFLQSSGFRIELLPTERGESQGIPFATVGGMLIEFSAPITGLPPVPGPIGDMDMNGAYGIRIQVGDTGARGFAEDFDRLSGPPITRPVTPTASGPISSPGSAAGSPVAAPTAPPTTAAPTPTTVRAQPAGALFDLFGGRLAFVYLAFTLSAMALCLSPRLTLPARLPAR